MYITIQRTLIRGEFCEGQLSIDGIKICHTLENSNSLVPAGEYHITLAKCKQYSRKMPVLNPEAPCSLCKKSLRSALPLGQSKNSPLGPTGRLPKQEPSSLNSVLPCYCPMLKPGNGVCGRLDGSILVGQRNCLGCLVHPKDAFDSLYERIRKSISRGHEVILVIKDIPSSPHSHPSTLYFV